MKSGHYSEQININPLEVDPLVDTLSSLTRSCTCCTDQYLTLFLEEQEDVMEFLNKEIIKTILEKKEVLSDELKKDFMVMNKEHTYAYRDNFIGYVLTDIHLLQHKQNIEIAKCLFEKGVPCPPPEKQKKDFASTFDYLEYLINNPRDLFFSLCACPLNVLTSTDGRCLLTNLEDENYNSLLDHANVMYEKGGQFQEQARLIYYLLYHTAFEINLIRDAKALNELVKIGKNYFGGIANFFHANKTDPKDINVLPPKTRAVVAKT